MKQRTLGKDGPRVSAIGFGAMVLSPGIYGEVDDQVSIATLQRGIDVGLTLIDTAFAYGGGHNEELIGRAVRGRRDQVVLATKGGLAFGASGPVFDGRPVALRANLETSLRRLGTTDVDVYYLHSADPNVPIEESIGEMARFVAEGKVRFLGVSNLPLEQVRRAHATHRLHASQDQYSLFYRRPDQEGRLAALRELGISLVAYSPLGQGVLGGAVPSRFAEGDFRAYAPRFQGEQLGKVQELGQRFRAIADEARLAPATLALAWLLHRAPDLVPIPGTRSPKNLEANLAAASIELEPALLERLDKTFTPDASMGEAW